MSVLFMFQAKAWLVSVSSAQEQGLYSICKIYTPLPVSEDILQNRYSELCSLTSI